MKYNRDFYYIYEPNICGGKTIIINGNTGEVYKTNIIGCKILDCIYDNEDITIDEISTLLKIQESTCDAFLDKFVEAGIVSIV